MTQYFSPPVVEGTRWILPETRGLKRRLFRYYGPHNQGENYFLLTDNTVTKAQPADFSTVVKTFYGGHREPVNSVEATYITASGFGEYLVEE